MFRSTKSHYSRLWPPIRTVARCGVGSFNHHIVEGAGNLVQLNKFFYINLCVCISVGQSVRGMVHTF